MKTIMKDFISIVRTDREREIFEYEKKGYLVNKDYRLVDSIYFYNPSKMSFRVEANKSEIYFLLQLSDANLYFSIEEIYRLLYMVAVQQGPYYVIDALQKQLAETEEKSEFKYKGVTYTIKKTVQVKEGTIRLNDCDVAVSYCELFTLINLIQEKSNAFFLWSKEKSEYKNGIIRLLIALLESKDNSQLLLSKGWEFSSEENMFRQNLNNDLYLKSQKEKQKYKYHLTEEEYSAIVQYKNPSIR